MFILPNDVNIELQGSSAFITFAKPIGIEFTEIDAFWIDGQGSYDLKTYGNSFYFSNLSLDTIYKFKLKVTSRLGAILESEIYEFKTIKPIVAKAPTNVKVEFDNDKRNDISITFNKGQGIRTEIDAFWINGSGTWDRYTVENKFQFSDLQWDTTYKFKLRSVSNDGTYSETDEFTFKTDTVEVASAPYEVEVTKQYPKANDFIVSFKNGNGIRTEIKKLWENEGVWSEVKNPFELKNLEFGKEYSFILRTIGVMQDTADTSPIVFLVDEEISPIAPTNIKCEIDDTIKNKVVISFKKGSGIANELEIDRSNTFSNSTTEEEFILEGLKFGKTYEVRLRSIGNNGQYSYSGYYRFTIKEPIKATAPSDINIDIKKDEVIISFKKGKGIKTELDKIWINGEGSWEEETEDNKFVISGLNTKFKYHFALRSVGEVEGDYAHTMNYSFEIPEIVEPTVPQDIEVTTEGTTAYVRFRKGKGVKTGIDKHWYDGKGTWDEFTTGNGFVLTGLTGTSYTFTLASFNEYGDIAEGIDTTFEIVENRVPTKPSNVSFHVEGTCVTIKFNKGVGAKTEIDCFWLKDEGTWDSETSGSAFYFENLNKDTIYKFRLRSVNSLGDAAETDIYTFKTLADNPSTGELVDVEAELNYSKYNNFEENWFYAPNYNNKPIGVTGDIRERFSQLNAWYCGNANEQKIYLTFDEGYEVGHTGGILDVLKKNKVNATFFITKKYLDGNLELVKRMCREGHTVGNHSVNHPSMANVAREGQLAFEEEILELQYEFKKKIGFDMLKVFRPPMGRYSELSLKYAKDLGYKSVFWSFSYADYDINNQRDPEWVLDYLRNATHNGCIFLLHAVSKTNAIILDEFIKYLKDSGYVISDLRSLA